MLLLNKKIGFITTVTQLGETIILGEIEKIMMQGADIFVILLNPCLQNRNLSGFRPSTLDLLVFFPDSEQLIGFLAEIAEEQKRPALVLAPNFESKQPPYRFITSLLEKKRTYFVPFGLVNKKEGKPAIYSRLDLLLETCTAALEGHQLQPYIWENNPFPP
ncbi:MAG: hypothetical protein ACOX6X_08700 [Dethiobacteria bacterium]|jgi:hypothetical protein